MVKKCFAQNTFWQHFNFETYVYNLYIKDIEIQEENYGVKFKKIIIIFNVAYNEDNKRSKICFEIILNHFMIFF